ncbi:hypothetical protein FBR01_10325 [Anaerolineae bacterium CFX8]|nr:hypothetical protein [Anaerolineae bacterium CFX8]
MVSTRMGDKQIQPVTTSREIALARRSRPRGLVGQISTVLLEPGTFFRALPLNEGSRQWVWAALLILALVGFSAVRQEALSGGAAGGTASPPALNQGGSGGSSLFPSDSSGFPGGALPSPFDTGAGTGTDSSASGSNVSATWTTALLAASSVILGWVVQMVMLCEVSLFNGTAPRLGRNLQIAVWSTVPVGLMAALQLLYFAAGGTAGQPGLSGLLAEWDIYADMPVFGKSVLLSLTSRLTLFWLWSLVLLYIGGRMALRGKTWAVLLVVVAWALVVVLLPVLTGAVAAPESETPAADLPAGLPNLFDLSSEGETLPGGETLPDLFTPPDGQNPAGDTLPGDVEPESTPPAGLFAPPDEQTAEPEAEPTRAIAPLPRSTPRQ